MPQTQHFTTIALINRIKRPLKKYILKRFHVFVDAPLHLDICLIMYTCIYALI